MLTGPVERAEFADYLWDYRWKDQHNDYINQRSLFDYNWCLFGLKGFLDYARSLPAKRLVDVGCGYGFGISTLAGTKIGSEFDMHATSLTNLGGLQKERLAKHDVTLHITPAERMRGFDPKSVSAILALFSITYAVHPLLVVERFDDILVPGGIIKTKFNTDDVLYNPSTRLMNIFSTAWKERGYDIASNREGVVLAIKPGGDNPESARLIMTRDRKYMDRMDF